MFIRSPYNFLILNYDYSDDSSSANTGNAGSKPSRDIDVCLFRGVLSSVVQELAKERSPVQVVLPTVKKIFIIPKLILNWNIPKGLIFRVYSMRVTCCGIETFLM